MGCVPLLGRHLSSEWTGTGRGSAEVCICNTAVIDLFYIQTVFLCPDSYTHYRHVRSFVRIV